MPSPTLRRRRTGLPEIEPTEATVAASNEPSFSMVPEKETPLARRPIGWRLQWPSFWGRRRTPFMPQESLAIKSAGPSSVQRMTGKWPVLLIGRSLLQA